MENKRHWKYLLRSVQILFLAFIFVIETSSSLFASASVPSPTCVNSSIFCPVSFTPGCTSGQVGQPMCRFLSGYGVVPGCKTSNSFYFYNAGCFPSSSTSSTSSSSSSSSSGSSSSTSSTGGICAIAPAYCSGTQKLCCNSSQPSCPGGVLVCTPTSKGTILECCKSGICSAQSVSCTTTTSSTSSTSSSSSLSSSGSSCINSCSSNCYQNSLTCNCICPTSSLLSCNIVPLTLLGNIRDYSVLDRLGEIEAAISASTNRATVLITLLNALNTGASINCLNNTPVTQVDNTDPVVIRRALERVNAFIIELGNAKLFWERLSTCPNIFNRQRTRINSILLASVVCIDPADNNCNLRRIRDLEMLLLALILQQPLLDANGNPDPSLVISGIDNFDATIIKQELSRLRRNILDNACSNI